MASKPKVIAPVDTDVVVPPAVRAAAAAAEATHAAAYPTDPAAAPAEAVASPAEPVAQVTLQGNASAPESWEHKYNSMKGRFERAELDKRHLIDRNAGLEQVIATMAVTAPVPAPAPVELSSAALITDADRETYGDDFINLAKKAAQESWSPVVASLQDQVKKLTDRLEGVGDYVAQTEQQRMHTYLDGKCPNWLTVNDMQEFKDWLALPDPYYGGNKHELLKAAYAANNAPRVLAFFQGFLAEEAASAPRPETVPTPPAPPPAKVDLSSLAAPGRAKTAAAPLAPAEKPSFTRAQVTQFYVDVANKKYVGRDAEKERIDSEIFAATREGRIS